LIYELTDCGTKWHKLNPNICKRIVTHTVVAWEWFGDAAVEINDALVINIETFSWVETLDDVGQVLQRGALAVDEQVALGLDCLRKGELHHGGKRVCYQGVKVLRVFDSSQVGRVAEARKKEDYIHF
jgi:hypothetical protein